VALSFQEISPLREKDRVMVNNQNIQVTDVMLAIVLLLFLLATTAGGMTGL
jgi:hypothetical protein